MSSLSPNPEMCIHFLYSVTIYNESAFYFIEIIVLISWEGTPTQIRMRVGSITFHACCGGVGGWGGCMMSQYVFFISKSWTIYMDTLFSYYLQRLSLLFPWNGYCYYFGGYLDSNKNGAGIGPMRGKHAFLIMETSPYSFGIFRKLSLYNCFMPI